ncbi:hypothetical protein N7465_007252 [Penicillium sp. CMV-2018d]|nr:hypothetical protein N7465_007252 [Penicillium sp. CMV-2018d]
MSFPAVNSPAGPSPGPLDAPVENSEGNTFDLQSLGASSPSRPPPSEPRSLLSPSPRFVNLDAEDATELPLASMMPFNRSRSIKCEVYWPRCRKSG